ncbi:(d)CMP kinase [Pectinatus sottacetonis]|uniref:(d)CMP kinase n=1 Tax=Pectinatus sottacetonis TaxID=1002795 RepID=UPI0018C57C26|nr:(d)CMP kinase [Pectinatus sottacetonis]
MKKIIAIDGPAGAGKSTVAQMTADYLGYTYIDTGSMYRAVAWKVLQHVPIDKLTDNDIINTVKKINVRLSYKNNKTEVYVNGQEISSELKTPAVNKIVSQVAKLRSVREKMVYLQRLMARNGAVVMDGRDIASNVLPNADLKIFLTASVQERANRRFQEMQKKGYNLSLEELKKDIVKRDKMDSERTIAPLIKTSDAVLIDTTGMTIDAVVAKILELSL